MKINFSFKKIFLIFLSVLVILFLVNHYKKIKSRESYMELRCAKDANPIIMDLLDLSCKEEKN